MGFSIFFLLATPQTCFQKSLDPKENILQPSKCESTLLKPLSFAGLENR